MIVFRSLESARGAFPPSALTVGNFDGVHAGHATVFRRVLELGKQWHAKPSAMTFHPHPLKIVAPERAPRLLSTLEERCEWMRQAGVEQVLAVPFDHSFSLLTPVEFVEHVLVGALGVKAVVVGDNFRFGHKHAGDTRLLAQLGKRYGFATEAAPALICRGEVISSSEIRRLVQEGEVTRAARFLGRWYAVSGVVVKGQGIGGKQTVPTLNLETEAEVLPAGGVYVTRATDVEDQRRWDAVTNIGFRPTFGGDTLTIETFLLEPLKGEPPARLRVEFLRRMREERQFASAAELKAQILRDVGTSQLFHRRARRWIGGPMHLGRHHN